MNVNLINLIKESLNENRCKSEIDVDKSDWNLVFQDAKRHNLVALAYYAINKLSLKKFLDDNLLNEWKRLVVIYSLRELRQIRSLKFLSEKLNKENMNYIILKGPSLKVLYPNKELRTMSDIDILVKEEDINKAKEIIINLGYKEKEDNKHEIHTEFSKGDEFIELHWKTLNTNFFKVSEKFEYEIWNNTKILDIDGMNIKVLNNEYMIAYLISHMAVHVVWSGFGIRQALDLYLYSKKNEKKINWYEVDRILNDLNLSKFASSIYCVIETLFGYEFKNNEIKKYKFEGEITDAFIKYIYDSGVFGNEDKAKELSKSIIHSEESLSTKRKIFKFLFPPINNLSNKYSYVKKYKILIFIAWIHHFICGIFHKEFSIKDKYNFIFKTNNMIKNKNEMLNQIGLK